MELKGRVLNKHDRAVLKEYVEALEDKNLSLAHRIFKANPDLQGDLLPLWEVWLEAGRVLR